MTATGYVSGVTVLADLRELCPGIVEQVPCPAYVRLEPGMAPEWSDCYTEHVATVAKMVMHLNDHAGWSRERIADWLETLDVDLTFRTEPVKSLATPPPAPANTVSDTFEYAQLDAKLMAAWYKFVLHAPLRRRSWPSQPTYWLLFDEPQPAKSWKYGSFPEKPTTPEVPAYDPLRTQSEYPAPDALEPKPFTRLGPERDWEAINKRFTVTLPPRKENHRVTVKR